MTAPVVPSIATALVLSTAELLHEIIDSALNYFMILYVFSDVLNGEYQPSSPEAFDVDCYRAVGTYSWDCVVGTVRMGICIHTIHRCYSTARTMLRTTTSLRTIIYEALDT